MGNWDLGPDRAKGYTEKVVDSDGGEIDPPAGRDPGAFAVDRLSSANVAETRLAMALEPSEEAGARGDREALRMELVERLPKRRLPVRSHRVQESAYSPDPPGSSAEGICCRPYPVAGGRRPTSARRRS